MPSRHRKQRKWRREIEEKQRRKKVEGATVGAVHPPGNQPFNPKSKGIGASFGTLSEVWPAVKWNC